MSRRVLLLHAGLFLVAYGGFLAHHWTTSRSGDAITALSLLRERIDDAAPMDHAQGARPMQETPNVAALPQPAVNPVVGEQLDPVTPLAETAGLTPETVAEVESLSAQALGAADPRERAQAIVQLRNLSKTPASLQALTQVLAADVVVQNRLFAITALADLLAQGDEDGSIAAALRHAALDVDPKVAARAQEAYARAVNSTVAVE